VSRLAPAFTVTTAVQAGRSTVAGQWRNFTAFPSILAIAVLNFATQSMSDRDDMKQVSMPSTFITGIHVEVKTQTWKPAMLANWGRCGDPGLIRTGDLQFRKLLLYPPELRGHVGLLSKG
jgi:hypothetical protein